MKRRLVPLVFALAVTSLADAKQCASVSMPETLTLEGKTLQLNGMGLREATFLNIDVYVAGLYLEQRSSDPKQIIDSESMKHVRLSLLRDIPKSDMSEQLEASFKRAAGKDYDKLKARFAQMAAWIPELHKGESFSITYQPGKGLTIQHGARVLGTIAGADFARTIFAIWLGDKPPNAGLKRGMLGGACG